MGHRLNFSGENSICEVELVHQCASAKEVLLLIIKNQQILASRTSFKHFGRKFNLWSWIGPSVCKCCTVLHLPCFGKLGEPPGDYFWKFGFSRNFCCFQVVRQNTENIARVKKLPWHWNSKIIFYVFVFLYFYLSVFCLFCLFVFLSSHTNLWEVGFYVTPSPSPSS